MVTIIKLGIIYIIFYLSSIAMGRLMAEFVHKMEKGGKKLIKWLQKKRLLAPKMKCPEVFH